MSTMREFANGGWISWQNLNERRGPNGSLVYGRPYHGRATWHVSGGGPALQISWNLWTDFCHAKFSTDRFDRGFHVALAVPPVALWFGVENLRWDWVRRVTREKREIGVSVHDGILWWRAWSDPDSWSSRTPRWRDGNFHFVDFVLGKPKHASVTIEETHALVPMPEGTYRATVKLTEDTWSRARGRTTRVRRAHVEMLDPIPFSGKGESDYDLNDDAVYGSTFPARTVEEAVGHMVQSVLETRRKRGDEPLWTGPRPRAVDAVTADEGTGR